MKILLFFIVLVLINCAATSRITSYESSRSTEENASSSSEEGKSLSSDESASRSSSLESTECKINYRYTIWIGDKVDEMHSIKLQSQCGIVFFDAMQQASQKREKFTFEYTTHPAFGSFVTQISGVSNDDEARTYWMMYDLTTEPDVANLPDDKYLSSMSVSSIKVLDGHSYLFWYRTVNSDDLDREEEDYYN